MKINRLFLFGVALIPFLWSCGDDDGDGGSSGSGSVLLSDVSDGEGMVNTTGHESISITGDATIEGGNGQATFNGSEDFYFRKYRINEGDKNVYINIYWPVAEGEMISAGDYPVQYTQSKTSKFSEVQIDSGTISYSEDSNSTGSVTISNVTAQNEVDIVINVTNLDSWEDYEVNASGALKYRN